MCLLVDGHVRVIVMTGEIYRGSEAVAPYQISTVDKRISRLIETDRPALYW